MEFILFELLTINTQIVLIDWLIDWLIRYNWLIIFTKLLNPNSADKIFVNNPLKDEKGLPCVLKVTRGTCVLKISVGTCVLILQCVHMYLCCNGYMCT